MTKKQIVALLFTALCIFKSGFAEQAKAEVVSEIIQDDQITSKDHKQISYELKTEIVFDDKKGFPLHDDIPDMAKFLNRHLNNSRYFDTKFVRDVKKVREHHIRKKYNKSDVGHVFTVTTDDGLALECTYFDRGSDTIAFIGSGFTNPREYLTPFVDLVDCDVVLFDFRGLGYKKRKLFSPSTWELNLAKRQFGVHSKKITLGLKEDLDVKAVVEFFTNRKKYKQSVGISVCYGALIFLKAQALYPHLFDKLVLDGCWLSLEDVLEKIRDDLKLVWDSQNGGWSEKWPLTKQWVKNLIEWIGYRIYGLPVYNEVNILPFLEKIKDTPLMFFHGKDDVMVFRNEFETIWDSVKNSPKIAVITSNPHVRNHFKQKELYKLLLDLFINLDQAHFQELLKNPEILKNYLIDIFTQSLSKPKSDTEIKVQRRKTVAA